MYRKLSAKLHEMGYSHQDLGRHLGLCNSSISQRFNGRTPWTLPEAYQALEFCQVELSQFSEYFPRVSVMKTGRVA